MGCLFKLLADLLNVLFIVVSSFTSAPGTNIVLVYSANVCVSEAYRERSGLYENHAC
jgi:hypothetical protein